MVNWLCTRQFNEERTVFSINSAETIFAFSSVQSLSHVRLFETPWTGFLSSMPGFLSITYFQSLSKLMSSESMMPSNYFILCRPLLFLPSIFPSIRVFSNDSALPMNTQDWSPLGWTSWLSLQSKGLSRVFSKTTVQKLQFFGAQLSL